MKPLSILLAIIAAGRAAAHPGHLAEAAGHNHWIGLAAIGTAVAVAVWAGLKGRRGDAAEPSDEDRGEAGQEA